MPLRDDASARQILILPSSDPESTYLLSGVNLTEKTLSTISTCVPEQNSTGYNLPLHSLCMINIP